VPFHNYYDHTFLFSFVVLPAASSGMDSRLPQHFGVTPPKNQSNKDVVGIFESFKAISTAHGVHHINHASGMRETLFLKVYYGSLRIHLYLLFR